MNNDYRVLADRARANTNELVGIITRLEAEIAALRAHPLHVACEKCGHFTKVVQESP